MPLFVNRILNNSKAKAALLFFFSFNLLLLVSRVLPFNGLYGKDAYVYMLYAMNRYEGDFRWPPVYPFLGKLSMNLLEPVMAMQVVSMLSFSLCILCMYKIIRELFHHKGGDYVYVFLLAALSPYLFRLGLSSMSDMCSILFCLTAWLYYLRFFKSNKLEVLFFALVFTCLAFFTHYSVVVMLIVPFFYALVQLGKWNRIALAGLSMFLLSAIVLLYKGDVFENLFTHELLKGWSVWNFFRSEYVGFGDGHQRFMLPNWLNATKVFFHPGFNFMGIILLGILIWIRKSSIPERFILISVILYCLFLSGLPVQNTRLQTPAYCLLVISYSPSFSWLFGMVKSKFYRILFSGMILMLNGWLITKAMHTLALQSAGDKEVAAALASIPSSKPLYLHGADDALRSYGIPNPMISLWNLKKIEINEPFLLLVNEQEIQNQWNGTRIDSNLTWIKNLYDPEVRHVFSNGFTLYEASGK